MLMFVKRPPKFCPYRRSKDYSIVHRKTCKMSSSCWTTEFTFMSLALGPEPGFDITLGRRQTYFSFYIHLIIIGSLIWKEIIHAEERFTGYRSTCTVVQYTWEDIILTLHSVPDHASRIRDVVLVRHIFSSGNPRGSGIWNGKGMGRGWKGGDQFTSNLGPRWTGSYHAKEGFQVSKRE
jgi:hypothetical protein